MTAEFISLAAITFSAFICPIIASLIPGKPIPETVFLLVLGVIFGPHVLDIIQTSAAIDLLSDLGLAFLFLLAGYEINPSSLFGEDGKRGLATWAITLAIAFVVIILWPDYSPTHLDGIAVAIALTTTAIGTLLPILEEREILNTRVGQAVVAYGTWGELAPVLAMTLLLSTRAEWQTILVLVGFLAVACISAIIPKIARHAGGKAFQFIIANKDTNSQMVIRTIVALLVGLTAVAEVFQLDIVLAAFAAGFILRFIIPEGSERMEGKLRAIGYGFFIPLFFIVSGARIDITAISSQPSLLVLFILLLLLVRALPILVALNTGKNTKSMGFNEKITVALYCTTALPLIVAVTTVAVSAQAMEQATASVLVAAGGITVLIMPVLASLTIRTANAEPLVMVNEIKTNPNHTLQILKEHRQLEKHRHKLLKKAGRTVTSNGYILGLTKEELSMMGKDPTLATPFLPHHPPIPSLTPKDNEDDATKN